MSLPRVLTLERGHLHQTPAPELEALRIQTLLDLERVLESGVQQVLPVQGDALELELTFRLQGLTSFELALRRSPDLPEDDTGEETRLYFEVASGVLSLDRSRSSACSSAAHASQTILSLTDSRNKTSPTLTLRVFLDASVLEVFALGQSLSARIYPSRFDSLGVALMARGENPRVRVRIWALEDVWEVV